MNKILFLCTGNYYRSRYAEILFNTRANALNLPWEAFSRGFSIDQSNNKGNISVHAKKALKKKKIKLKKPVRQPLSLVISDFEKATYTIAMKETEHKMHMAIQYPHLIDTIEYWHIDDIDCASPSLMLPEIERKVGALIVSIQCSTNILLAKRTVL